MTIYTEAEQREHRRLWVEALRSGKYQQTTCCLHDSGGFCCLGVACDISKIGDWEPDETYGFVYLLADDVDDSVLPSAVQRWLGLRTNDGTTFIDDVKLWWLNDNGKRFAEIADIIEAEPAGLITTPSQAA